MVGVADNMWCPCFPKLKRSSNDEEREPLLLVSGIGGSILNSKRKKFGFQTRVWVRILLADLEFKKRIWSLYNPKTGNFTLFSRLPI